MSGAKVNLGTGKNRYRFLFQFGDDSAAPQCRRYVNANNFARAVALFGEIFPEAEVLSVIKVGAKK